MNSAPSLVVRLVRFRLRTLLIAISFIAIWISLLTYRAEQLKKAIQVIENSGGVVSDYDPFTNSPQRTLESAGLKWSRAFIGEYYFRSPSVVRFIGSPADYSSSLSSHQPAPISQETIQAISKLTNITTLIFDTRPIQLIDLDNLRGLPKLDTLQLAIMPDSPAQHASHLRQLAEFSELHTLTISDLPDVSGQLSFLSDLPKLKHLSIEAAGLASEDLVTIGTLSQLKTLSLGRVAIDGNTVAKLISLNTLYLRGDIEFDNTLHQALVSLRDLRILGLPKSSVSAVQIEALQRDLPGCQMTTY